MDATWAMHAAGYKLGYAGNAVALTVDPESFTVWRAQMRRWASGYAQNMAKYRRHLLHPKALLVVGTALFDLVSLFWSWAFFAYLVGTGRGGMLLSIYAVYFGLHVRAQRDPGRDRRRHREAVVAFVPWFLVNIYTRWLYLAALFREWILAATTRPGRPSAQSRGA